MRLSALPGGTLLWTIDDAANDRKSGNAEVLAHLRCYLYSPSPSSSYAQQLRIARVTESHASMVYPQKCGYLAGAQSAWRGWSASIDSCCGLEPRDTMLPGGVRKP